MQATFKQQRFMRTLKDQHPIAWQHAGKGLPEIERMTKTDASRAIGKLTEFVVYNPGSQRAKIAEILRSEGMSEHKAIRRIEPMVGTRPLLWSRNVNGSRVALPIGEQKTRMRQTVAQVAAEMRNKPEIPDYSPDAPDDVENVVESPQPDRENEPDWMKEMREAMEGQGESDEGEGEESEDGEGEGEGEVENMTEEEQREYYARSFLQFVRQARDYWSERNADGITAESVGMRPTLNGGKMIRQGIPVESVKHAMAIHWPQGTLDEISKVKTRKRARKADAKKHPATAFAQDQVPVLAEKTGESVHNTLPYIVTLAGARVPIALIGTHGTGKTEIARQLALTFDWSADTREHWDSELPFGFVSMTEGTPPSAFYGRSFPEYVMSTFLRAYRYGGVFLFDEMDAAHPNLLLIVNSALANGEFANPVTGEIIHRHKDFIAVCAMNTTGMGADRNYTGRKRLDAAALDRWHMGRVQVPIDEDLEERLFFAIVREDQQQIPEPEAPREPTVDELEEIFQNA
jgi:MoxR-like ATPase